MPAPLISHADVAVVRIHDQLVLALFVASQALVEFEKLRADPKGERRVLGVVKHPFAALDEVASKKLLKAYGIPVSKEEIAQTAAEAVRIAKTIGFPIDAKIVSADILHKSDIGGVVLNINSAAEVKKAFTDITNRVKKLKGKPKLEGILIAQQVKADLELVVGAALDAEMGPVVLFGTGGVDIELMKDVALAGAPLDAAEARELINRTKAGVKLKGYRGKPALHEPSVIKAIVGLSNLMADAGNRIASTPYVYGGGHGQWDDRGYDCSGSVSYALFGGGLIPEPLTSGSLEGWGEPGPGKWITVYANRKHTFMVVAGLRFDTRGDLPGVTGPRWHEWIVDAHRFVPRHPPRL